MDANQHVNNVKYIGWILEVTKSLLSHLLVTVLARIVLTNTPMGRISTS